MNRQLRRAQAKQDQKAERERDKKRQARKDKAAAIKERRKQRRLPTAKPEQRQAVNTANLTKEQRKKLPGRFSGALMFATVFFIVLQAAIPTEDASLQDSLVGAGFFLMFGYFSVLYLNRRGTERAFTLTIASAGALAVGVLLTRVIGASKQEMDSLFLLMVGLGAVLAVAGAYLGRAVFNAGLRQ